VKCEAYFTGAAPGKRLQSGGLKRIGLVKPVGYLFGGSSAFLGDHRGPTDRMAARAN
jgi:hypothetical protein